MYAFDGIVLGSPTYGRQPNAIMKNFFDRLGMFTVYTSSLAGKYVVGISTAGGFGANKVARELADIMFGMFGHGYVAGTLGVLRGWERIEEKPEALLQARDLGRKLVDDIEERRRHPFQALSTKMMTALIVRRFILRNILDNREDRMRAVHENLVARGLIKPAGQSQQLEEQLASS